MRLAYERDTREETWVLDERLEFERSGVNDYRNMEYHWGPSISQYSRPKLDDGRAVVVERDTKSGGGDDPSRALYRTTSVPFMPFNACSPTVQRKA